MVIFQAVPGGHCKKICILLFYNKNEVIERRSECTNQNCYDPESGTERKQIRMQIIYWTTDMLFPFFYLQSH